MHNSPNELKSRIIRAISYLLIAIFVALGTYYLANYAQGILINPATGDSIQNGLVIIQSKPVNASVNINNQIAQENTPTRQILPVGNYDVILAAEGYRNWTKQFTVVGSDIVWLDYPLLIPEKIKTTQEAVFAEKPVAVVSNNRRLLATGSKNELKLFNVSGKNTTESAIDLPKTIIESLGDKPKLKALEFAGNDRYLLAQYTSDKTNTFIRIDRENPDESINLNDLFDMELTHLTFGGNSNFDNFYAQSKNGLHRLDVGDEESQKIAENINQFFIFKNFVFIITNHPTKPDFAQVSYIRNDNQTTLAQIPKSDKYLIEAQQFKNRVNLAVANDKTAYVYKDIERKVAKPTEINIKAGKLEFTSNGRFMAVSNDKTVEVIDLEFKRDFKFEIKIKPAGIHWIDNFRLGTVSEGIARTIDFDGNNNQAIAPADPTFTPVTNQNNQSLLTISKDTNRYVLERSRLRVE